MALLLAIAGSALLVHYQGIGAITTIGLTTIGISLVIGIKSIVDLYAKLIGVTSVLGDSLNAGQEVERAD